MSKYSDYIVTGGGGGESVLNGTGVPSAGLGNDGDTYIDNYTGFYYKKETGSWVKKRQMGVTISSTAPSSPDTHDLWLDISNL